MEERKKIRFISPEPRLALALRRIPPIIAPEIKDWWNSWLEDVGRVMRSRDMMVANVASMAYYAIFLLAFRTIPALREMKFVRELLRV